MQPAERSTQNFDGYSDITQAMGNGTLPQRLPGRPPSGHSEIAQRVMDAWLRQQHAYAESFNARVRDDCLNVHWFITIERARQVIEQWRRSGCRSSMCT